MLGGSAAEKFYEFCDRYLGKHSATLNGTELSYAVKFYSLAGGMLSSKLLLKLQRHVIERFEQGDLQVSELTFIARIYAESGVTQNALFVLLAEQLSDPSKLDLNSFVDAYAALTTFKYSTGSSTLFRAEIIELENILVHNLDKLPLKSVIDVYQSQIHLASPVLP